MVRTLVLVSVVLLAGLSGQHNPGTQDQTGKRLDKIKEYVAAAGKLYVDEQFQSSAKKISAAQKLLERAIRDGKKEYRKALESEYGRIAKAHKLLTARGIELSALAPFPKDFGTRKNIDDTRDGAKEPGQGSTRGSTRQISFERQVTPLLVKYCGVCHVRGSRGEFSMSTFNKLMDADVLSPGKPEDSLMIELMESGDMPPRGEVPEKEFDLIKKWILQGAKFDGDDKKETIGANQPGRGR